MNNAWSRWWWKKSRNFSPHTWWTQQTAKLFTLETFVVYGKCFRHGSASNKFEKRYDVVLFQGVAQLRFISRNKDKTLTFPTLSLFEGWYDFIKITIYLSYQSFFDQHIYNQGSHIHAFQAMCNKPSKIIFFALIHGTICQKVWLKLAPVH